MTSHLRTAVRTLTQRFSAVSGPIPINRGVSESPWVVLSISEEFLPEYERNTGGISIGIYFPLRCVNGCGCFHIFRCASFFVDFGITMI